MSQTIMTTSPIRRNRKASSTGSSLLLSVHRHFLFFVIVCFSLCCNSPQSSQNGALWSGCCVAASIVRPKDKQEEDSVLLKANNAKNKEFQRNQPSRRSKETSKLSMNEILTRAWKRGLGGGISGALAGIVQVLALMWMRTITNYQCRYGTTFRQALNTLMKEGGVRRLYRGLAFALIQAPLTRFVSTASNDGVGSLLLSFPATELWGPEKTTVVASLVVGLARILLMPIDTMKTVLQVDSVDGFRSLMRRLKMGKFMVLYEGALAVAIMGVVGHYPWFLTYNLLSNKEWLKEKISSSLLRNAFIGFLSSIVSDTATNVFRVVKTTKQVTGSKSGSSYMEVIRMIMAADGWKGLFGRGLYTRLASNALQSILFTVVWRGTAEWMKQRNENNSEETG